MTDPATPTTQDTLDETLARISKKSGVKATLVLDRATGSLLRTSGQISALRTTNTAQSPSAVAFPTEQADGEGKGVEDFARLVWGWVNASGGLVGELDAEDEVKLLRLRTKKQELVIVPDAKYLLVVVHDTPTA
ncbi:uncharacterized protein DNG_02880 [Cephalotrichum gorgonifer]|uniref:Roadblock/LAMTOR2 domain-containing protein n=1 Tax=Cephalotrichum gorgonifer TaxID=2041049 RepID=A0AAE8ST14_9PEZI|nr:uncharacterized protein DNG_02880 [Cephalotrichum gorgonifer]